MVVARPAPYSAVGGHRAALKKREQRADEWIKTVPQTDYRAIVDGLRALRRSKEALNVQLAEQFPDRD